MNPTTGASGRQRVSRADHREQTRAAILASARRLFAEHGFHDVSAEQVALDAGVTERTLFRYFPTKASLVLHPFLDMVPELMEIIASRPAEEPPYPAVLESLFVLAGRHAELLIRDPGPSWRSTELPPAERERMLRGFVDPLTETLRTRYRIRPAARLQAEVWARACVGALVAALNEAAEAQRTRARRVRVGKRLRAAFAALDGQV